MLLCYWRVKNLLPWALSPKAPVTHHISIQMFRYKQSQCVCVCESERVKEFGGHFSQISNLYFQPSVLKLDSMNSLLCELLDGSNSFTVPLFRCSLYGTNNKQC